MECNDVLEVALKESISGGMECISDVAGTPFTIAYSIAHGDNQYSFLA
jgi:hypothetical protein